MHGAIGADERNLSQTAKRRSVQHRFESGPSRRRRIAGPSALAPRAALGRRQQFYGCVGGHTRNSAVARHIMGDAPKRISVTRQTPNKVSMTQAPSINPTAERERMLLAPYAMHSADSSGRRYPEASHAYRGAYQRDRDRIVHSSAFRRLSQKTQVFTGEMGDYHRTRLTHTLEVSSIARTIARALRLNEDLVEALALAHDLGHPPFGHSGEEVLNECLQSEGGFNHNAQALRICELLESGYPDFPGLNLTS